MKTLFLSSMKFVNTARCVALSFLTMFVLSSQGQTVILETDFSAGIPEGWSVFDEDGLTPSETLSVFDAAWISWIDEIDTAAASTSFYDPAGTAEDYLVTPRISLGNFSRLVWSARSVDASYPDGYQVLISETDSLPDSFTDTLWFTGAASPYYQTFTVQLDELGYANQDVFIAIRNTTNDGYILLLDRLKIYGAETASFSEIPKDNDLLLYPNPAKDILNISIKGDADLIQILDNTGRVVIQTTNKSIDIKSLTPGLYHTVVTSGTAIQRQSFIKS